MHDLHNNTHNTLVNNDVYEISTVLSNITQCDTTLTFYGESGIVNGDDRMSASAYGEQCLWGKPLGNCSTSFRTLYSAILSNNDV